LADDSSPHARPTATEVKQIIMIQAGTVSYLKSVAYLDLKPSDFKQPIFLISAKSISEDEKEGHKLIDCRECRVHFLGQQTNMLATTKRAVIDKDSNLATLSDCTISWSIAVVGPDLQDFCSVE